MGKALHTDGKVANATPTEAGGTRFKSRLEAAVWRRLREAGYEPEYEPEAVTLQGAFRPSRPWLLDGVPQTTAKGAAKEVRALTYTPDFRVRVGGVTWWVEAKGFETDRFPLKRKLFLKLLESRPDERYAQVDRAGCLGRLVEAMEAQRREGRGGPGF